MHPDEFKRHLREVGDAESLLEKPRRAYGGANSIKRLLEMQRDVKMQLTYRLPGEYEEYLWGRADL